jgi:hypothetical protein
MTAEAGPQEGRAGASLWGKLIGVRRDFGVAAGTLYLVDRMLRRLGRRCRLCVYELFAQPIDGKSLLPERLARHISFREIGAADPDLLRMPVPMPTLQGRFAQGARCLGVWRRAELLGYVWLVRNEYDEDEARCTYVLPPARPGVGVGDSVFDFDLYLFPEHRMGVGFVALWHAAARHLHVQAVTCSYSRMTRFNLASRRAHLRLGSKVVGRALFLCLGRFECMLSTLHPYLAASWSARVRLRLPSP